MKRIRLIIISMLLSVSILVTVSASIELYKSTVYIKNDNGIYEKAENNTVSLINYPVSEQWEKIKNSSHLDISVHGQSDETVKADYYFYNDNISLVTGNNDNSKIMLSVDFEMSENTVIEISEGVSSEEQLEVKQDYRRVAAEINGGDSSILSKEFIPKYEVTYYNVKITDGDKSAVVKMRAEVQAGSIEVYGFQMNTDTSVGAVSQFMPSFRTVSRCSKLITKDNDSGLSNKPVYAVKDIGTIYGNYLAEDKEMVLNSQSENVKYYQAGEAGILKNWPQAVDKDSYYYALTFRFLNYNWKYLTSEWKLRAYAVTYDGDVVLSKNIETTKIYNIAKTLYNRELMSNVNAHNFLYDNVLNPITIEKNANKIANSMLKAMQIRNTQTLEYTLVNNVFQDMYKYIYFQNPYNNTLYHERGKFKAKTITIYNGITYNTEEKLLDMLNASTNTAYISLADWIYGESTALGFDNFYPITEYKKINLVKPEEM